MVKVFWYEHQASEARFRTHLLSSAASRGRNQFPMAIPRLPLVIVSLEPNLHDDIKLLRFEVEVSHVSSWYVP